MLKIVIVQRIIMLNNALEDGGGGNKFDLCPIEKTVHLLIFRDILYIVCLCVTAVNVSHSVLQPPPPSFFLAQLRHLLLPSDPRPPPWQQTSEPTKKGVWIGIGATSPERPFTLLGLRRRAPTGLVTSQPVSVWGSKR